MSLLSRWKAPTPAFFKKVIRVSLLAAVGGAAALGVEPVGQMLVKGFTFTMHPFVILICKNLVATGIIVAAVAKAAKTDVIEETLSIKKTTVTDDSGEVTHKTETNFSKTAAPNDAELNK